MIRIHEQLQSVSAISGLLAGPVLFISTGAAVLAQPTDFSVVNHPGSDLGAMTADNPWISNVGSYLTGVLLFVFAVGYGARLAAVLRHGPGPSWSASRLWRRS